MDAWLPMAVRTVVRNPKSNIYNSKRHKHTRHIVLVRRSTTNPLLREGKVCTRVCIIDLDGAGTTSRTKSPTRPPRYMYLPSNRGQPMASDTPKRDGISPRQETRPRTAESSRVAMCRIDMNISARDKSGIEDLLYAKTRDTRHDGSHQLQLLSFLPTLAESTMYFAYHPPCST